MADRHKPNSWDGYLAVHASKIDDYLGHFILDDRLSVTLTADLVAWTGELICADGIEIHVSKRPEWVGAHGWPTLGDVLDEAYRWWMSRS